jgi:hypothetical protein
MAIEPSGNSGGKQMRVAPRRISQRSVPSL